MDAHQYRAVRFQHEAAMEDVGLRHLDGDAVPHEHRKNNAI